MSNRIATTLGALAVCAVTLTASSAFADGVGTVAKADEQTHLLSVTFSPLHLAQPIVEFTAEFKANDQWGVAGIGGVGSVTSQDDVIGEQTFSVWEAGGQLRYYVLGNFDHGMELGAEVMYINVSNDNIEVSGQSYSGTADGVSVGPFVGYKIATDIGFTFDGQLGIQRVGIGAEAQNNQSGESGTATRDEWGPLLNLNVGWSF